MAHPSPKNRNFLIEIFVPDLLANNDVSADHWEATSALDNYLENYLRDNLTEILTKCGVKWKDK
jgi:hypothetical protein